MRIILDIEQIEIGSDANGPRHMDVYTFKVARSVTQLRKKGMIVVEETTELPPESLPYIIWRSAEPSRVRFRWSRRHLGKTEMRMGIATHGAQDTVRACVRACIANHQIREEVRKT